MLWNELTVKHSARITVVKILYQLLLLHEGPINKFKLSIPGLERCPEIDNLILFLSRNGIQDLCLEIWREEVYILPLSFFTCQKLRNLRLFGCRLIVPPLFQGFSALTTLKLNAVTITAEALTSLISSSPLLEQLEVDFASDCIIEIIAPSLKTFNFYGMVKSLTFRKSPFLASISMVLNEYGLEEKFWEGRACHLVEFFRSLPVLESLELSYTILKSFAAGEVPTRLPTSLVHLKRLQLLAMRFHELDDLSLALCLIRSSPNLKYISITFCTLPRPGDDFFARENTKSIEGEEYSDLMLNELKGVKLQYVRGTRLEMEFIKLLLAKSPCLEKMQIAPGPSILRHGCEILKQLSKFRRLSKDAEVIYAVRLRA